MGSPNAALQETPGFAAWDPFTDPTDAKEGRTTHYELAEVGPKAPEEWDPFEDLEMLELAGDLALEAEDADALEVWIRQAKVMSAQDAQAALPNGVGTLEVPMPSSSVRAKAENGTGPVAKPSGSVSQQHDREMGPSEAASSGMRNMDAGRMRPVLETTAKAVQGERNVVLTTPDLGGRSELDMSTPVPQAAENGGGFTTPKSVASVRTVVQPAWLAGVEVPKWVSRLGNFLQPGAPALQASDLAPSPFPGGSPAYASPPPGGQAFRLRSPARTRAIPSAPSPPSSSSIPAEAIQAEVQRQLQGIMGQLREFGDENQRLRHELAEARAQLRVDQDRNGQEEHTMYRQDQIEDYHSITKELEVHPKVKVIQAGLLEGRGRGRNPTPPPRQETRESPGSPVLDALAKGVQQLQELQVQALSKATLNAASSDVVKPGTIALMSMPEVRTGADAAVMFQDWIEVSSSVMGDLSESSSIWWKGVVDLVQSTYERWLAASPLERIGVEPQGSEQWTSGRWLRVNARASTMLLTSMPEDLRVDIVSRRLTQDCVRMLFRTFTFYQPGGSAERQDVLKRLQNPGDYAGGESLEAALKAVRAWPRWLERCRAVKMAPPDASVLARGLLNLTDKHINLSADAAFRTSMLRTTLRLDSCPSTDQVQAYQRHLQAELEAMMTAKSSTATGVALKAVEPVLQPKARDAGAKPTGSELCRYFAKAGGCRRGEKCSYSHSMVGMDKETRSRKCLKCGAESHRQKDCPVGRPNPKATGGTPKSFASTTTPTSTMATVATTSTGSTGASEPVQGTPWTLETLMQAAQQVVQAQTAEPSGDTSPEKTRPTMKVLRVKDLRVCSMRGTTTALVDSGATHSLRTAKSPEEWMEAEEVAVQLAGSHQLTMRLSRTGTLLMPYREKVIKPEEEGDVKAQTIVPMGQLIQTLGYSMTWTPEACYLTAPDGTRLPMRTESGCPEISELEALTLIARLEDRKLDLLNNEVLATADKLSVSALAMERHWNHYLYDYVSKGSFESGLRAVRDAPFFADLPGECLSELIPAAGLWSGWDIMKQVGFMSRPQRRKLWSSKRWIVHVFAGTKGHWEFFKLDQNDTSVIELDVNRCAGHNLMRNEVWRMLLWGAREGKVDVVMGAPPGRSCEYSGKGQRDIKDVKLVARMMWLYVVAQVGRELNGSGSTKDRDVGFVLEYPEGTTQEERETQRQRVEAADQEYRAHERGGLASWSQTASYWESVQRPRWEEFAGVHTLDAKASFWDTRLWKSFQREGELRTVSFDQGAMGGATRNRTTLGTNLNNLMSLDGVRVPEGDPLPDRGEHDHVWAPGLVRALVVALSFWDGDPRCVPRMCAMTQAQWKEHVDSNHATYRKDCATCVMGRGLGRQHRRVHHPEAYVLTADMAGPLSPGLDSTSKGAMGKNLKYLLVAKYMVPKEFIANYSDAEPPGDHGVPAGEPEPSDKVEEFFAESKDQEEVPAATVQLVPEEVPDGEELDYEPSEPEGPEDESREHDGDDQEEPGGQDTVMVGGECHPPEMTFLTFAVALPNNQSNSVRRALQDIVLYLQMHGLPVYRFHGDKGEFFNHQFRSWLRDQGVFGTWSGPSVPQSNGHAESTVRWIKDRTRTFLKAASLPVRLWPVAAAMVAAEQRGKVLGWQSRLAAPFGAPVYLRKKAFDKAGPLRREHGLESKWTVGKYVGLSTIVHNGHLVYVEAQEGEREKFLHTLHVKAGLTEPGGPVDTYRADEPPKPRRRVVEKTHPSGVEMRALAKNPEELYKLIKGRSLTLLSNWCTLAALELVEQLAKKGFFDAKKFGVYRHGGIVGWLDGVREFPELTQVMTRLVVELEPEAVFTSVMVSYNAQREMHKDFNNDYQTQNYVIPVVCPDRGGELWVELKSGDVLQGVIEEREVSTKKMYGQLMPLEPGHCLKFGPQRHHEVAPWEGVRIALIAYTPDCLGKLSQEDLEVLHDHGFPIPLSQLPEYHGDLREQKPQIQAMKVDEDADGGSMESEWSMYLGIEEGMAKDPENRGTYAENIEVVLANLKAPLDVTYNIKPEEVYANLEKWRPAIEKEVKGLEIGIQRLHPGTDSRREWLNTPGVQRLPMKFVFTVKPNDQAKPEDRGTWFKRKARLVICGNMAMSEVLQLYAETAPAEAVRSALVLTCKNRWMIGILDITAAFLKTPLGRRKGDPIVVAQPPRLLELMGITVKFELWALLRALYGLREAPMLWCNFRDETMRSLPAPRGLRWQQGRAITSWWTMRDSCGKVCAVIVVYVDDYLICGPRDIVMEISDIIQRVWDTTELTFLGPGSDVRFLGMELRRESETSEEIYVLQQGYIQELLRLHEVKSTHRDKVPITKDLATVPDKEEDHDEEMVRRAQQITGEVLWVAQRTRPDVSYTTSMMASMCSKFPRQVLQIGFKTLGYLQRTMDYALVIKWEEKGLVMFCDAAYAPQGLRSHGGWVVTYGGTPVVWRSGKQSMITLSTAEAELLAMLDGAVAMKGVEAILSDAGEQVMFRQIASDSTSALSISGGTSSWRTRHLRIKAGWLQEQLAQGLLETVHCPGERQPADLLTKPLSSARTDDLLRWWKVKEYDAKVVCSLSVPTVSTRLLVAMVCCILMVSVQAAEEEEDRPRARRGQGLQVDWDLAGVMMVLLMLLGGLMVWEAVRWCCLEFYYEWTPGSSARKLRRLRKLQQATTTAIEQELLRLQSEGDGLREKVGNPKTKNTNSTTKVDLTQNYLKPVDAWNKS
ncbi:RE1 [Symbiodinium sp. CCMP2592]|nr:RE1 [Symbiodinium sp. CCMP2592]